MLIYGIFIYIPVNPWLLGAMGNGPCCIASWWSLVSCGEIAAEEGCKSERGDRERNGEIGKHRQREKQNTHTLINTDPKKLPTEKKHLSRSCVQTSYLIKSYTDYRCLQKITACPTGKQIFFFSKGYSSICWKCFLTASKIRKIQRKRALNMHRNIAPQLTPLEVEGKCLYVGIIVIKDK